jgi:TRAP-type C4-dicarboxylate transport system permease small subunit
VAFAALWRGFERLSLAAALLGVGALFGAMAVTVADIVLRPFDTAVPGVVDMVQLAVMAGAFLAIPYTFMSDGHVSVDLLARHLPDRVSALLRLLAAVLASGLLALMARYGWGSAWQQHAFGDVSQTIGIPIVWYWSPLLAGLVLSTLATLLLTARELGRLILGHDPVDWTTRA